jgi:hypothetical protein
MTPMLTRHSFLNAVRCPRLGWFSRQDTPPLALSPERDTLAERFLADEAHEVHDRARVCFPGAVTVSRRAFQAACWQTQDLIERPGTGALLEAAFTAANCRVRADALVRDGEGWRLHEMKACTRVTDQAIGELAYAWMVLDAAGVELYGASLVLLSGSYHQGMPDAEMFVTSDATESVSKRAQEFHRQLNAVDSVTKSLKPPLPQLIPYCRLCPLFRTCTGMGAESHILELPHLSRARMEHFIDSGYTTIRDIQESVSLSPLQLLARRSLLRGEVEVGEGLQVALDSIQWPIHYLDVETATSAIPLLQGLAPFERMPFLYSVRLAESQGDPGVHRSFLAPHDRDGTRELAERLLVDLGGEGTVLVYSGHEQRALRWLARRHHDLSEPLTRIQSRVVRLESIIRHGAYHPDFHGTTSFERVLAALVPGFSYMDLEIEDAPSARAAYLCLLKGGYYSSTRAPLVRRDLYAYCARDTLGLRRLHDALRRVASQARPAESPAQEPPH